MRVLMIICILCASIQVSFAQGVSPSPGIALQDEGSNQGRVQILNCTGTGIACSKTGVTGTINVAGGGGGAPTTAQYLVGVADATLSNEIVISPLTDDTVIVANGTTWEIKTMPDCDDTGGNHLNYDTATNTFSCGTSGGGGGSGLTHPQVMARVSMGF